MEAFQQPTAMEIPRYPNPQTGPFRVRLWFRRIDGRPAVVGVEMWGIEPEVQVWDPPAVPHREAPITAKAVRLPLGKMLDDWVQVNENLANATLAWPDEGQQDRVDLFLGELAGKRSGRPGLTDEFLRYVLDVHQQAVRSGSRSPSLDVAVAVSAQRGEEVVPTTARTWVRKAKKRFGGLKQQEG